MQYRKKQGKMHRGELGKKGQLNYLTSRWVSMVDRSDVFRWFTCA